MKNKSLGVRSSDFCEWHNSIQDVPYNDKDWLMYEPDYSKTEFDEIGCYPWRFRIIEKER